MSDSGRDRFQVNPQYQPLMRQIGLDAAAVFSHPDINVWRSIPERENCTLDATLDGREIRLHIKRYRATRGSQTPADEEVRGIQALLGQEIPTVSLVGWGRLADGRSFVISEDLKDFRAADQAIASGFPFDRLIDAARVRRLPWLFRQRWIVKDLAQFWYSARRLGIVEDQIIRWLGRYTDKAGKLAPPLGAIEAKVSWIARHDSKLNQSQPNRNVSIPRPRGT